MFLAFQLSDLIRIPFGYVLDYLYQFTTNYGVALILFAIIVRLVLIPVNAKSKKSMMKMSRLQPRIQEIQRKYENDKQKQQEEIQKLQQEEGASMGCGGCLWSLIPLFIMLPLYHVVRQPIQYMLHESVDTANAIVELIKNAKPEYFGSNNYYDQMVAVSHLGEFVEAIKAAGIQVADKTLQSFNFSFIGIDLSQIPTFNIFGEAWKWDWNHIGGFLIPILTGGSQVLQMWLSQNSNNSVITNKDGVQDKEAAANSQSAQQTKMMMWMMPLMSLWIGFTVPAALSLYWFVGGLVSMIENHFMTAHYRKVYDAEDALRLQAALEREREEAERERLRAEKRAANPDGITENTSKKKLQQKQRAEEEAARAAAAREYAARKGILEEEVLEEKQTLSGVADRPYCKGRAYDPNRYNSSEE
jgi:YidC/Oxa1 family membrane protein insertase